MNILIGKIGAYMKDVVKKNSRLVSFFNRSHIYNGLLADAAKVYGIKRGLKISVETRWYSTALMFKSVLSHL